MILAWLLACTDGGGWTEADALSPSLAALDRNHDGRVTTAEYESLHVEGTAMPEVDTNADGVVSDAELLAVLVTEDPVGPVGKPAGKHGRKPGGKQKGAGGKGDNTPKTNPAQTRREAQLECVLVLESLREEILFANPAAVVPSDAEFSTAAVGGSLLTVEGRAVLGTLEAASDAAHVAFPPSLRAAHLATQPVAPTLPPLPGPQPGLNPVYEGEHTATGTPPAARPGQPPG